MRLPYPLRVRKTCPVFPIIVRREAQAFRVEHRFLQDSLQLACSNAVFAAKRLDSAGLAPPARAEGDAVVRPPGGDRRHRGYDRAEQQ
jgi:hypothetical protein